MKKALIIAIMFCLIAVAIAAFRPSLPAWMTNRPIPYHENELEKL